MMMGSSCNLNQNQNHNALFTAAQWEELEIYGFRSSSPYSPHLVCQNKFISFFQFTISPTHATLGVWEGSFQYNQLYGYGSLEPGRCRRTDGKKWRCSKEAYPDSKYAHASWFKKACGILSINQYSY